MSTSAVARALAATRPASSQSPQVSVPATLEEETELARAMAEPDVQPEDDLDIAATSTPARAAATKAVATPVAHTKISAQPLKAETIHKLVKKLAIETAAQPAASAAPAAAPPAPAAEPVISGDAITESVKALRAAAEAMKPRDEQSSEISPTTTEDALAFAQDLNQDQEARLAALAEALSADRIDVMLEPILGLKDHATRHYEVSINLKTADGSVLDPSEDRAYLRGTGILPLIDLAKISRIAEVARKLAERGKSGAVFTGVAGESLSDDDFLSRFSDVYNDRAAITDQLVVSLAQEDVRTFAPGHWSMIKDLSSVGFRFALEHVTDLDMDFDSLKSANIQYVKLDAEVYLQGLGAGNGVMVPPADVYRFLADKGLSLIVDHIQDETQLVKIVDFGALYGQGRLFGGPRPVKAKVFTAARTAA